MSYQFNKIPSTIFLLLISIAISGCAYKAQGVVYSPFNARVIFSKKRYKPPTEAEQLENSRHKLRSLLAHHDVQLIQVGDEYRLVLPADHFFHYRTPRLREDAYYDMDNIKAYINTFKKVAVEIIGYTDNQCSITRNFALSRARAQAIAEYLWMHQLDARVLHAGGDSHCEPISTNRTAQGRSQNQRIEISWRKIVD